MSYHERVRSALPLLGAFASLVVLGVAPFQAGAQTYEASLEPFPYASLPIEGGTATSLTTSDFSGSQVEITLPFSFYFFDEEVSVVRVGADGIVTIGTQFSAATNAKRVIPSTSAVPHNFVAVWWDQMYCNQGGSGPVQVQEFYSSTPRRWAVEWAGCRRFSGGATSSKFHAQLWLTEGSSDIEVRYGPMLDNNFPSGTYRFQAAMGIENADGTDGTPGPSIGGTICNPTCQFPDFPTDHRIVYTSGPAAAIDSVSINPTPATIGSQLTLSAMVTNGRSKPLDNVTLRYWVGPGPSIADAQDVGMVTGVTVPGNGSVDLPFTVDTTDWKPGQYYVIAELDPFGMHFPLDEPRIVRTGGPVQVKHPTAALRVLGNTVQAPGWLAAEATFDISFDVENRDLLDVNDAMYAVVLSTDTVLDDSDAVLGVGYFSLASMAQTSITKTVKLPPGLADGRYWIGVWADPYEEIPHSDRSASRRVATSQTTVGLELEIVTTAVPGGRVGDAYSVDLRAHGGDGTYVWTVDAGSLPPDLAITRASGVDRIVGIPSAAGTFEFTLKAASDRFTADATFSIEILPALVPLEIATTDLPGATLGSVYTAQLVARGGTPPYLWSFDGAGPEGLVISPTGRFGGTPTAEGRQVMYVAVEDASGARTTVSFSLEVEVAPLVCADVSNLAPVMVGADFHPLTLRASGGKAPYEWSNVSGAVPGLTLTGDGRIDGVPSEAGTFAWKVGVADALANSARCTISLEVTEKPKPVELKIATNSLPQGRVLDPYEVQLEANGVTGTLSWGLGGDALPEGLVLTESGVIRGVPSPAQLGGEASRTFEFEVKAIDSAQKEARATLHLELFDDREPVQPAEPTTRTVKKEGDGCQSASGDASLLVLGLALGLAALGRRRSGR